MIGKTISHYRIIDEVSRGGMGNRLADLLQDFVVGESAAEHEVIVEILSGPVDAKQEGRGKDLAGVGMQSFSMC